MHKIDGIMQRVVIEGRSARAGGKYFCVTCNLTPGLHAVSTIYEWDSPEFTGSEFGREFLSSLAAGVAWGWWGLLVPTNAMDAVCIGMFSFEAVSGKKYGIDVLHPAADSTPTEMQIVDLNSGEVVSSAACEPLADQNL